MKNVRLKHAESTNTIGSIERMRSNPEKYKIYSKCMHVEAMTEKVEVSFAEERKRLMDL